MSAFVYSTYKLLSLLVFPLSMSLSVLAAAGVLFQFCRRRTALALAVGAAAWLWFWSMPLVSDSMRGSLEAQYPFQAATNYPQADVIVVLGGEHLRVRSFMLTFHPCHANLAMCPVRFA